MSYLVEYQILLCVSMPSVRSAKVDFPFIIFFFFYSVYFATGLFSSISKHFMFSFYFPQRFISFPVVYIYFKYKIKNLV